MWRDALLGYLPALASVPLLAAWFLSRPKATGGGSLALGLSPFDIIRSLVSINLRDPTPLLVLTLQFAWVLSLLALGRWALELFRALWRRRPPKALALQYLDALFFAVLFVETRIRTFTNLRYYLPIYPLLLLCGYAALRGARPAMRSLAVGALAGFFLLSSLRTVDPLSRALVPTFAFGDHDLLALGLLDSCCGLGRDQLAYNLEHAEFHYLQEQIYADVQPGLTRGLAAAHNADWFFMGRLEPRTFRRTLGGDATGQMQGRLLRTAEVAQGQRPARLFYLRLPNFARDNARDEATLLKWYDRIGEKMYQRHGYGIEVAEYRLRR